MKQRITYIVQNPDAFSPEQLDVRRDVFAVKDVEAAKEHRITLGLDELPDEVRLSKSPHLQHRHVWRTEKDSSC